MVINHLSWRAFWRHRLYVPYVGFSWVRPSSDGSRSLTPLIAVGRLSCCFSEQTFFAGKKATRTCSLELVQRTALRFLYTLRLEFVEL